MFFFSPLSLTKTFTRFDYISNTKGVLKEAGNAYSLRTHEFTSGLLVKASNSISLQMKNKASNFNNQFKQNLCIPNVQLKEHIDWLMSTEETL